jgi:Raf kinase inhibitor-like YbhB/YbcL family protein
MKHYAQTGAPQTAPSALPSRSADIGGNNMNWRMALVSGLAALLAARADAMELTSPEMAEGASLATDQVYGECGGANVSPSLAWSGAPAAAKSFALTAFDPDANGSGWWHWIVIDIPANVHDLAKGAGNAAIPAGAVQAKNDFGDNSYDGACPPSGSGLHHYQFTLWALNAPAVPFDASVTGAKIGAYLQTHAIAKAQLTPVYQR